MCPYPFFEVTPPGAAPGPPVKTGARVRRFRGCNKSTPCGGGEFKGKATKARLLGTPSPADVEKAELLGSGSSRKFSAESIGVHV